MKYRYRLKYFRYHSVYFYESNDLKEVARFAYTLMDENLGAPVEILDNATGALIILDNLDGMDKIEEILNDTFGKEKIAEEVPPVSIPDNVESYTPEVSDFVILEDTEEMPVKKKRTKRK